MGSKLGETGNWAEGRFADPARTREAAGDILAALNSIEPELQELREAAKRPFAKLELNYPDPISADIPNFWEGWISNRWSAQHLADFQNRLIAVDLLTTVDRAVRSGERAGINYIMEHQTNEQIANVFLPGTPAGFWDAFRQRLIEAGIRYSPRSWRFKNQLFYNRLLDETFFNSIHVSSQRVFPKRCQESAAKLDKIFARTTPFNFLAAVATPNFKRAFETLSRNQAALNQAVLVCALERYRLKHGEYPPALETLAPEFIAKLPHDIVTGEPLKYRRTDDGKFLLYSVGWNEKDDGANPDRQNGDWVWPVEAK